MGHPTKPGTKINWGVAGTEPGAGKKAAGYAVDEKWPAQYANWLHYITDQWLKWAEDSADFLREKESYGILCGTSIDADYASFAAYIADAPAAGDRVYIANDEVITSKLTIPDGITIRLRRGAKFSTTANLADLLEIGDEVEIEGNLLVYCGHTGTITNGVIFNGHGSCSQNIVLHNASTGTITNAYIINAAKKTNFARGETINDGGGTITNYLVDNSGLLSNDIQVRERS